MARYFLALFRSPAPEARSDRVDVTILLEEVQQGVPGAADRLAARVYDDLHAMSILGDFLTTAGRYGEAETLLLSGEAGLVTARGQSAPIVADARRRLVRLYQAWKRPDDAARWQAKLDATK